MLPQEHDERLLELESLLREKVKAMTVSERILRVSAGQRRKNGEWSGDIPDDESMQLDRYRSAVSDVQEIEAAIAAHETHYMGWSRYRLVISSDGHVHANSSCRTFRSTTKTIVIPALSDQGPEAVVEMLGQVCCSICISITGRSDVKVPASLVNILLRKGTKAFEEAVKRRQDLTHRKDRV